MGVVIGCCAREKIGYRFRTSLFGKQILQIGYVEHMDDTNTGSGEFKREKYYDASPHQANDFLKEKL